MKKSYLIIAAVAMSLTACVQNEDLTFEEFKDVAIDFQSQGIEKATRAELDMDWFLTKDNAFGVNGFKDEEKSIQIFSDEKVWCESASGDGTWEHSTVRFWDKTVSTYNFYAFAPYATSNVSFDKNTGYTFSGLNVFSNVASGDYDKAIAIAQGIGYTNLCGKDHENAPTVPLIFKHVLSKLSFKVKTSCDVEGVTIYLKEIKAQFPTASATKWAQSSVDAVSGEATYTTYNAASLVQVASGNATVSGDAKTGCTTSVYASTAASGDALTASGDAKGNTYIVVPVNSTVDSHEFAILVKYDIQYSDILEEDCYATGAITYSPNSNDNYVLTIDVNPAKIDFCVDKVDAWTDAGFDDDLVVK